MRILLSLLLLAATARAEVVEFHNGRWFDGRRFVARTMLSVDGVLARSTTRPVDRVISLDGKFVIPPLAEGHNHWLEPQSIAEYNRRYLADGVFYVMDQANMPTIADRVRAATNKPDTVDYAVAMFGFTGPGGHPLEIVRQFVDMGVLPAEWKDDPDRRAVFVVRSEKDIDERWPLLLSSHTDFVKVFLLYSGAPLGGFDRGIDPALVPAIVKRAHRDGLRVSAHAYDANDFRVAVRAGVDIVAHFPGTGAGEHPDQLARYRITDADARLAAQKGVTVITTLGWLNEVPELAPRIEREVIIPNLKLLLRHCVRIAIGSDQFRQTPLPELFILARLGLVSNAEILRMATMVTPRLIFPQRKIGSLLPGSEASFLVLNDDPTQNLGAVREILLRVKKGRIVP